MAKKKKERRSVPLTPEWPHKFETAVLGDKPVRVHLETTEQQRKDLARRAGVEAVDVLEADLTVMRATGNKLIHVKGFLKGLVIQDCAVSLKPVQNEVVDEFEGWYTDHEDVISLAGVRRERDKMLSGGELPVAEEHEDPEPAVDGAIDLGELAAQYFCLAVNPYPHAEDSNYENYVDAVASAPPPKRPNPFAALKDWKDGRGGDKS